MKAKTKPSLRVCSGLMILAAAALLLSGPFTSASDDRDAPTVSLYSAVDINDLYMFRSPSGCAAAAAGCNLVMIMSVQPFADPSAGPTYHFQPNAVYRFSFSTTPDDIVKGKPTASIDFVFSTFDNNSTCPAPNPPCQTYTATFPDGSVVDGLTTQGSFTATPKPAVITSAGPISVFAGPREDPFFFDRVGFGRFLADFNGQTTTPAVPHFNLFTGKDAYLGKNISAISVEFPITMLLSPGSTKLAAWAVTYLLPRHASSDSIASSDGNSLHSRQVDREGNPFVHLSLISPPLNDAFDFSLPKNDAADFGPTITGNLIHYGVDQTNVLPALTTALVPDTLKFDTSLPDGYLQVPPNGRQLSDRVTDFFLTLDFNVQGPPGTQHPGGVTCPQLAETAFSDCTNPKVFLSVFPFVGPPLQPAP